MDEGKDSYSESLRHHRKTIDKIDRQLVALLHDRARVVRSLGQLKGGHSRPLPDPQREERILDRVRQHASEGPFSAAVLEAIFRLVLDHCRDDQLPLGAADEASPDRDQV